ncbi:MAG: hypothetical protein CO108_28800 [Deltaproteobacteria bacterium CG_4_9_14_3_um_filter_63_12]|nr:MAG: hypothetical protein CO108_28800 [Deltaproteobacteria bacterium CG_4_9_14_3_um_filter_63_12]
MLLHRLDGPGVVEHIEVIEDDGLLDPLAARVEPVREPIEHDVVLARLAHVERLYADALHLDPDLVWAIGDGQIEAPNNLLVTARPTDISTQ